MFHSCLPARPLAQIRRSKLRSLVGAYFGLLISNVVPVNAGIAESPSTSYGRMSPATFSVPTSSISVGSSHAHRVVAAVTNGIDSAAEVAGVSRTSRIVPFALLIVLGILWIFYRRANRAPERPATIASNKSEVWRETDQGTASANLVGESSSPRNTAEISAAAEIDLRLLRHLSDNTTEGFHREINRYLFEFQSDLRKAHTIFATGDRRQIHHIAHRLIAHSGAVHCEPLINLATTMQSEAALLPQTKLDDLLGAFDREFAQLRNKLDSLRASTARG